MPLRGAMPRRSGILGDMSDEASRRDERQSLAVGDRRRVAIGKAAFSTLWTAIVFFLFTVPTKQIKPVYNHAPWLNDPYDTLYSFAMFVVPLATAFLLVQVSVCRKVEVLPAERARSVLRGCRVAAIVMTATLASCWISLAVGANRAQWNDSTTTALVVGLAVVTGLDIRAVVMLVRAPRLGRSGPSHSEAIDDWLGDAILVARSESRWFGPFRSLVTPVIAWCDRTVIARLRQHPILGAALASLAFGTGVGLNQGILEGYFFASILLTVGLLTCGMFAFLMLAGSYLGVVRSGAPLAGVQRRLIDATVIACIAALVALAFRNSLWWIIGTNANAAGNGQFAGLLGIAVAAAFAAGFAIESIMRTHTERYARS